MHICEPTMQVPTSVHFWADARGCRDREGESERGRGDGLPPFTLSSFTLVIKLKWNKIRVDLRMKNDVLHPFLGKKRTFDV